MVIVSVGTLNFEEIIDRDNINKDEEVEKIEAVKVEQKSREEENKADVASDQIPVEPQKYKSTVPYIDPKALQYMALQLMTYEQLKRSILKETITVPANLRMNYEYYTLRNKLLQGSCFFPFVSLDFEYNTLQGAVDINKCIRQGLLQPSEANPRLLTKEEKEAVLTLNNSPNLSIPMRYYVLRTLMKKKKRLIKQANEEELLKIDEFGVTLKNSYKLLKAISIDLKEYILQNKKNIRQSQTIRGCSVNQTCLTEGDSKNVCNVCIVGTSLSAETDSVSSEAGSSDADTNQP